MLAKNREWLVLRGERFAARASLATHPSPLTTHHSLLTSRPALTLLEVVISLAIFLIAVVPIWGLITVGSERAMETNLQAQASLLCQSKLDSVKAGIEQFNTNGTVTIANIDWNYNIESNDADVEYLHFVKVTVKYERGNGKTTEAVLSQFVYDPNQRGSTIAASTLVPATSSTGSSTTGGN
jgi:hypothetical protein